MVAGIVVGVLGFLGLCALASGIYAIEQQTVGIIERFGKYLKTTPPGLHYRIPIVDHIAERVSLRIRQLDLPIESKTQDNVFVIIKLAIQYCVPKIEKAFDAHYKLVEPGKQIEAWVYDVVRATVPTIILDDVFEKKDAIAKDVETHIKEKMELYGFEIVRALVNDIEPDAKVKAAMNTINEQARMKLAAENEGEAKKILVVKAAEAQARNKALQGEGVANQRKAIIKGFQEAITDFKEVSEVSQKDIMDFVAMTMYFDTLKELGGDARSKVVFLPSTPGAAGEFLNQIRNAFLTGVETTDSAQPEAKSKESTKG